ncbi:hypothetical protein F5Y12DRAFT_722480 [Xylaria sp. FL1777]|nr:hypothetical protein F5Y12DRAFT_722480 [Xylaria sp. FL1777]
MDRNPPETAGVLATKPNGRKNNTQPLGNRRLSRKSSGNTESKENSITSDTDGGVRAIPRPTRISIRGHRQSDSLIEQRFASPSPGFGADRSTTVLGTPRHSQNTRIPRPAASSSTDSHRRDTPERQDKSPDNSSVHSSPMRQPMNLKAAFKRAQEQTAAEARSDSDNTMDLQEAFRMANEEFNGIQGIDGSPSPAPRSSRREFKSTIPTKNGVGVRNNDLNKHLEKFDRNHQLAGGDGPLEGLFAKNRTRSTVSEMGFTSAKKSSDDSPGGNRERQRPGVQTGSSRNQEKIEESGNLVGKLPAPGAYSGKADVDIPIPSIEYESASDDRLSPNLQPPNISPEKSMNWHLDDDFTAGDLQFSASPRIAFEKHSSHLAHQVDTPVPRLNNDRLNQIHQREIEAARTTFPEEPVVKQMNHKLEEIRARELEASSRRALASSRLDEIKLRNSEPRSESPETRKDSSTKPLEENLAKLDDERQSALGSSSNPESRGEPIRDTPVVIFKQSSGRVLGARDEERIQENNDKSGALSRRDSHDLLRRLARATSSSPREDQKGVGKTEDLPIIEKAGIKQLSGGNLNRSPSRQEDGKVRNLETKNSRDRLTVGFADLVRVPSSDSVAEKRRSMSTSEADPTDRIAAELNLFAPLDNYSEKGSIRAPSPVPSEPIDEKTPRPSKIDPLTQPTPRVVGAYVDTPATVRVKEEERHVNTSEKPPVAPELTSTTQSETSSLPPTKRTLNTGATNPARSLRRSGSRSSSVPTASRRSRSSSRRRRPLINTARPPTVRDDIIAILRANNIDDSTLENLDSILADHEVDDLELKQMVNDSVLKVEDDPDMKFSETSDRERELAAYDRMSKSLQTGLLGIRSAKKGIERLEDKVTHNSATDDQSDPKALSSASPPSLPPLIRDGTSPAVISVPRLYRKDPKFKLTTLGVVTLCTIIWYVLECTFCFLYAGPEYICTPTIPCDWSSNEPYFPYTMPFMLDEWTTGGKGRALALRAGEEIGDMVADISDWVTNTDFTQFDERYMNVWQRKRHRRRLRKHALVPKWKEPPGYKARYADWQATTAARELAQELGLEEDETIGADEIVR